MVTDKEDCRPQWQQWGYGWVRNPETSSVTAEMIIWENWNKKEEWEMMDS